MTLTFLRDFLEESDASSLSVSLDDISQRINDAIRNSDGGVGVLQDLQNTVEQIPSSLREDNETASL